MKNAVFFITVDSLRSDFVTRDYKEGVRLTPFLDKLSAKATVFSNFYANSIPTFFAFPSIFSGRFPFYNGNRLGIDKGESFVEYLRDLGYLTLAFQANNSWLGRQYGYSNGFLEYEDFSAIGGYSNRKFKSMARALLPGCAKDFLKVARLFINRDLPAFSPDAMKVTDKVVDRVRSIDSNSNVFVWVHYLDVHWKYLNGLLKFESILNRRATFTELRKMLKNFPKYLEYSRNPQSIRNGKLEIPNDEVDFAKDLYASSVSYTDHAIERLFEVVKNVFCDRRTVFVVTSDHGENFAEHGTVIHEPTQLFNEVLRVPFVLYDSASSEETKVISLST